MYFSVLATLGQICKVLKRLYLHKCRYDEVIDGLSAARDKAVVGDGLLPDTTMGPVNNAKQLALIRDMLAEARASRCDIRFQSF